MRQSRLTEISSSLSTIYTDLINKVLLAKFRKQPLTSLGIYCMCKLTVFRNKCVVPISRQA